VISRQGHPQPCLSHFQSPQQVAKHLPNCIPSFTFFSYLAGRISNFKSLLLENSLAVLEGHE
jgi:hypothetical protein